MKPITILLSTLFSFVTTTSILAQNPVTTLQHNGGTQVFYGQNSFVDAYSASVNGDTLYLSAGYFNRPYPIEKGLVVIGSGHFPDSADVKRRTYINDLIQINKGADNLHLEGLYINAEIRYDPNNSINNIKILKCRLSSACFNSVSADASKNNCSFEECIITENIFFNNYGNNLLIAHCIVGNNITNVNGNALFDGNIFINYSQGGFFGGIFSSLIRNNIFLGPLIGNNCSGNIISNNLFTINSSNFATNTFSGNYLGVPQTDIFVYQSGYFFNYSHNYHLKNPELYLGTDGTQVGLYGGSTPFKEKGRPSNPQVTSAKIDNTTDKNGKLNISVTVKAQ